MRRSKKPQLPDMEIVLDLERNVLDINGIKYEYQWIEPRNLPRRRLFYRFCGIELLPDGILKKPGDDKAA